jgi:hypothetical protein
MAPTCPHKIPAVLLQQANNFTDLHIRKDMPHRSGSQFRAREFTQDGHG